jgi:hypothetical protein
MRTLPQWRRKLEQWMAGCWQISAGGRVGQDQRRGFSGRLEKFACISNSFGLLLLEETVLTAECSHQCFLFRSVRVGSRLPRYLEGDGI